MDDTGRRKRKQGRPMAAQDAVGREGLLVAAAQLLQALPPAQVTATAIAREAGADPALIRYYFGSREALLLEVVKRLTSGEDEIDRSADPVRAIEERIHAVFRFTRSAKHMQRLMIEELDVARSPEVRESVAVWNRVPIDFYDQVRGEDGGEELAPFDSLFLHLAVIGISDFFVSGAPLVEMLAPPGTDMAELGRRYEAFVTRLLLDGLRKR